MPSPPLFTSGPLLGPDFPLPLDRPFTTEQARSAGVSRKVIDRLLRDGYLRRLLRGVYVAAHVRDDLITRARALFLVAPRDAVVTDWTAVWLFTGILPPGQHLDTPPVCFFRHAGGPRLRNQLCTSGERTFRADDLMELHGLVVTTPLRTALDIGRLSHRDTAFAGLDALVRTGAFTVTDLVASVERFAGHRGVVQLRELAPRADPRAQSPGESILRLRWLDLVDLPRPTPQVPILDDAGREMFYLDLGVPELRYAAEYDGEEHHSEDADREHDDRRRRWIEHNRGWEIDVARKENLFGATRDIEGMLYQGIQRARRRLCRAS